MAPGLGMAPSMPVPPLGCHRSSEAARLNGDYDRGHAQRRRHRRRVPRRPARRPPGPARTGLPHGPRRHARRLHRDDGLGHDHLGVPLAVFPDTYNGQPLGYVALAAQKQQNSLYLLGLYADSAEADDFRARWTADGTRLDMGKSCVRFRTLDAERLRLVADTVAATTPDDLIALHERSRAERR